MKTSTIQVSEIEGQYFLTVRVKPHGFVSFPENRCMDKYKSTPKFGEDEEESIYRESDHIDSQATRVRSEGLRPLSRAWYQSTDLL
jgi:hypothetical protein